MTEPTQDPSLTPNSTHLPLELLLSISVSVLTLLAVTAVLVYRVYNKKDDKTRILETSSSTLMFSDPEENWRWLDDLRSLRYLGLEKLNKPRRPRGPFFDVKCRGQDILDDNTCLIGLPARPHNVFFPGRRDSSSCRSVIRRSWIQNLFHSSCGRLVNGVTNLQSNTQSVPEIRITVPSMVIDGESPILPHDRRWSGIIAHDLGLANNSTQRYADSEKSESSLALAARRRSDNRYPPSSMATLPFPARQRLSSSSDVAHRTEHDARSLLRPLSPITESRESLVTNCSDLGAAISETEMRHSALGSETSLNQGTLMASYGLALLRSCSSMKSTSSSSSYQGRSFSRSGIANDNPPEAYSDLSGGSYSRSHRVPLSSSDNYRTIASEPDRESQDDSAPGPRHFFVCNPDTSEYASSPSSSSSSLTANSWPSTSGRAREGALTSSSHSMRNDFNPAPISSVSGSPLLFSEPDRSDLSDIYPVELMGSEERSTVLTGVERWIDDDVDLFYYSAPVDHGH